MGRRRSPARAHWPPNLYAKRNGFIYRNPLTKDETWLRTDEEMAISAARCLNKIIAPYLVDEFIERFIWADAGAAKRIAARMAERHMFVHQVLMTGAQLQSKPKK